MKRNFFVFFLALPLAIYLLISQAGAEEPSGFKIMIGTEEDNKATPTLILQEDFPRKKEKISTLLNYGAELTKNILNSYVFLAEFDVAERPSYPKNWLSREKYPLETMLAGDPFQFGHPNLELEFPFFRAPKLTYLVGTDKLVQEINTFLDNWNARRFQDAMDASDESIAYLKEQKFSTNKIEVILAWTLRGFFLMEMNANNKTVISQKSEDYVRKELTKSEMHSMARTAFRNAFITYTVDQLISTVSFDVDEELFSSQLSCPYFNEDKDQAISCKFKLLERNLEPLFLLRSLGPAVLWNLAVFQRMTGLWDEAFLATEYLDTFFARLEPKYLQKIIWPYNTESPVLTPSNIMISSPLRVWPHVHKDLLSAGKYLRAYAMVHANDPQEILSYADAGIRTAASPELSAVGFLFAGTVFFDLNNFRWARKAFSWCEGVSSEFSQKYPYCVLFGAESAFWEGRFPVAKKAFEKAFSLSGDKEYGPWLRFRIANILQQNLKEEEAQIYYSEIVRLFSDHIIYPDALVRTYCNQIFNEEFNRENRSKMATKINIALGAARQELRLQAKTCTLYSALQNTYEDTGADINKLVPDAKAQLALLTAYQNEFPNSKYLPLFSDRLAKLDLSFVQDYANKNECKELIKAYQEQKKFLNSLNDTGKKYLKTLVWGTKERKVVFRCAALENDIELWEEMRKTDVGDDGKDIGAALFKYQKSKGKQRETLALINTVIKVMGYENWDELTDKIDFFGKQYVPNQYFWESLAAETLLRQDLKKSPKDRAQVRASILNMLGKSPKSVLNSAVACGWVLDAKEKISEAKWDTLAKAKDHTEWLDFLLEKNQLYNTVQICNSKIASELLGRFIKKGSKFRDSFLVLPYLEAKGIKQFPDLWLAFIVNLEKREGRTAKIKQYYARLEKESSDNRIQDIAKAWKERVQDDE